MPMKSMLHLDGDDAPDIKALASDKRRKKNCALSIAQEQQLCALYQRGWSGKRLAEKYKVTKALCYKILGVYDVDKRGQGRPCRKKK